MRQLKTLALKVIEGWLLEEMKAEDQSYKMRWLNQKIADSFQNLQPIYANAI
jgi:hypothetical protein